MAKEKKRFSVLINKKYSEEIIVTATTKAEARQKAFDRYSKKKVKRSDYDVWENEL